jgi:hypothetical protein
MVKPVSRTMAKATVGIGTVGIGMKATNGSISGLRGRAVEWPQRFPAAQSVQINLRSEEVGREGSDHLLGSGAPFGFRQLQR